MNKTHLDKKHVSNSRRSFLRKSAIVGGGVATAASMPGQALAEADEVVPSTKTEEGYRMTEHIAEYYKSAKV